MGQLCWEPSATRWESVSVYAIYTTVVMIVVTVICIHVTGIMLMYTSTECMHMYVILNMRVSPTLLLDI